MTAGLMSCVDAKQAPARKARYPYRGQDAESEMRQRKDETAEEYAARRAAYNKARRSTPDGAAKNRAWAAAWREKNRDRKLALDAIWRAENATALQASRAEWKRQNPDKLRAYKHKRRKACGGGSLSGDIVSRLMMLQRLKCVNCAASLKTGSHIDHVIPLALGGLNVDSNVQLLCPPCNSRKGAKDPVGFAQEQGRLL